MWRERNGGFDLEVFEFNFRPLGTSYPLPSRVLRLTFRLRPPHVSFGNRSLHTSSEALGARTRHWINREGFRISASLGAPDTDQRPSADGGWISIQGVEGFSLPPLRHPGFKLRQKSVISSTEKLLRHPRRGGNRWFNWPSSSTERHVPRTIGYLVARAVSPAWGPHGRCRQATLTGTAFHPLVDQCPFPSFLLRNLRRA
jgi:hypothetical protein